MKEAYLYKKLQNQKVQCQTCEHKCQISPNNVGVCGIRKNLKGTLYNFAYNKITAANIDPIEKKPFYHFLPGTYSFSIATAGCNFSCDWCQNWHISQLPKKGERIEGLGLSPKRIVQEAIDNDCHTIAYTYTEPTVFLELALDTMKIAHKKSIKNIWVSNGYFSNETFKKIKPYLNAINIDLKGFSDKNYQKYCGARLKPILKNIKKIVKAGIHLEITTLIIPKVNDDEKQLTQIARFIAKIDKKIPWHISRFHPAYKFQDAKMTPAKTLEKAKKIGEKAGLENIYIGNI